MTQTHNRLVLVSGLFG